MFQTDGCRRLHIYDTTLRDGEQAPGHAMAPDIKIQVARSLAALGVDVIEAGFPGASEMDWSAAEQISREIKGVTICAFARATPRDIELADTATRHAGARQVEILGTGSDLHLTVKRRISRAQALDEIAQSVEYARALGFDDIQVAPEDATRADPEFLQQMCITAAAAGARTIVLPDTVGMMLPSQTYAFVQSVRAWLPREIRLSFHAHNDLGLAVANSLAAIEAGVDEIQTTLCGVGERAGNAALDEVAAALWLHPSNYKVMTGLALSKLYPTCRQLIDLLGLPVSLSKPVIGDNAFATAAGIHQSGILKEPRTYEVLDPAAFGTGRRMAISRHSGREALRTKLDTLGIEPDLGTVEYVYGKLVQGGERAVFSDAFIRTLALGFHAERANA